MRSSPRGCFLCLFGILFAAVAFAQVIVSPANDPPTSPHQRYSRTTHTVSVATLSVPAKARKLMEKAWRAFLSGHRAEAHKHADAALAIFPKYADALTVRAYLALSEDRYSDAIADGQQAIAADPGLAEAYSVVGNAWNRLDRPDEALPTLELGFATDPRCITCSFELAKAHYLKHDFSAALHYLDITETLRLPKRMRRDIQLVRAYTLLGLGRPEDGAALLTAYLASEPQSKLAPSVRYMLAQLATFRATEQYSAQPSQIPSPSP